MPVSFGTLSFPTLFCSLAFLRMVDGASPVVGPETASSSRAWGQLSHVVKRIGCWSADPGLGRWPRLIGGGGAEAVVEPSMWKREAEEGEARRPGAWTLGLLPPTTPPQGASPGDTLILAQGEPRWMATSGTERIRMRRVEPLHQCSLVTARREEICLCFCLLTGRENCKGCPHGTSPFSVAASGSAWNTLEGSAQRSPRGPQQEPQ